MQISVSSHLILWAFIEVETLQVVNKSIQLAINQLPYIIVKSHQYKIEENFLIYIRLEVE